MSPNNALLAIRDLDTWFQSPDGALVKAVNRVTLDVATGQSLGIVGESGSGKTQTFHSVFGLSHGWPGVVSGSARFMDTELLDGLGAHVRITPDSNEVFKDSKRWNRVHRAHLAPILGRDVALMSQDPKRSLVPYWTAGQHLFHVLRRLDASADNLLGRAEQLLSRFGFRDPGEQLAKYPADMSGGQAQRIMLALAAAAQPRLLIADEPTSALDAVSQMRVLDELQRLHRDSGLALVLISHDLAVVERVVDSLVVMFRGHVLERAPVSVLSSEDAIHPYTQALRESQRRRANGHSIRTDIAHHVDAQSGPGCSYAARCSLRPRLSPALQARCTSALPPITAVGETHDVACWGVS